MGHVLNNNGDTWGVLEMLCAPSCHPIASAEQEIWVHLKMGYTMEYTSKIHQFIAYLKKEKKRKNPMRCLRVFPWLSQIVSYSTSQPVLDPTGSNWAPNQKEEHAFVINQKLIQGALMLIATFLH